MALRDAFADLLDAGTPANSANSAKTRANTGPQPDLGACESLRILRIGAAPAEKFAGFADIRKPANGPQTRASACDSQNSQHSQGVMVKTCAGCLNRLRHGTCGEPVSAGLAPKFEIRWPPAGHAKNCPAYTAKAHTPAQDRPYRLTKDQGDACHWPVWSDGEIAAFTERTLNFIRRGVNATDADDLSERLTLRDREGLGMHLCLECAHYRPGRCGNHHAAGLGGPGLPHDLATQLQRCPGFRLSDAPTTR